jgi:hypothetical protein
VQHDEIKVNENSIIFVKKTKLLGVMIDDCLSFEDHTMYVCGKVTSKVATLTRNLSIFSVRYRFIIIKMFIVPHFEYCSVLFFNNLGSNFNKLEKKYNWSFSRVVNIKPKNYANLTIFYEFLKKHKLLPLQIKLFNHFCFFLFKIIQNKNLCKKLFPNIIAKENSRTRSAYNTDCSKTHYKKYSFSFLSSRILNNFLDMHSNKSLKEFTKFVCENNLILYNKCKDYFSFN